MASLRANEKQLAAESARARVLEEALRGAREELEQHVDVWAAELIAANAALRRELDDRDKGSTKQLLEASARLGRLEEALRCVPEQVEEGVRARTVHLVSANVALRQSVGEHEAAERKLAAVNAELQQEIAERERHEAERREAERRLREVDARFESAFSHAPIGMALVDVAGRLLQVNEALCRITGCARDELTGTSLRAITHPDDLDLDADCLRQLHAGQIASYQVEKRYRHAWGHSVWVLLTVSVVRDDEGEPLHLISQVQDISERKELEVHLEHLVDHDFLTGLVNRRRFEHELRLQVERAARYGSAGAVLLIDLDNFKDVNDTLGHKAGDDLLKGIAGVLRQRTRGTDVLARLGGDEFALLLPQADASQAEIVADEFVKALRRHVAVLGEEPICMTASIGVALFDSLSDVELLGCADLAMYEAKEAGRNRFVLYRPGKGGRGRASGPFAEGERIRRALEEDRLLLYCQPILDLASDEVCQYELLLRLQDDQSGEPLPPSAFLYAAERFGLIQAIDSWVMRQAVALIADHARAGRRLVLEVNLSGKSIGDAELAALIEQTLAEAAIDPACLIFELTETAAIANIEQAKSFASRLRALGCQLALDDFGAGFGSFFYLKNLPFDYLKIDGDFIRGLAASPIDQLVVEAIVGIARGMGKKTIAEFVPDEEVACLLRTTGVNYAQGHHVGLSRPVMDTLSLA